MKSSDEWERLHKALDDMLLGKRGRVLSDEEVALNEAMKPDPEPEPEWVTKARKQAVLDEQTRQAY